jgi:hypothetical protein
MSRGGLSSSCGRFVQQCSYSSEFSGLTPGSPEFSAKWLEVCGIDSDGFGQEQHDFIQSEYYDIALNKLRNLGIDEATICFGVRELIWSTAVQFGPTGCYNIFARAGINNSTESLDIIDKVYKEKSRVTSYFKSSSSSVQNSVLKRYCTERLQNIDACNGEECDEVPQGIENASFEDLTEITTDSKDLSVKDGYEEFIL